MKLKATSKAANINRGDRKMKHTKRILTMILVLVLVLSFIPVANAYESYGDTAYVTEPNELPAVLENSSVSTIIVDTDVAYTGSLTIPSGKYVLFYKALEVQDGSELVVEGGAALELDYYLYVDGTVINNGEIYSYGAPIVGNESTTNVITGNGVLNLYDTDTFYYDEAGNPTGVSEIYYGYIQDVTVSCEQCHYLNVTTANFNNVEDMSVYDSVYVVPSYQSGANKLTISSEIVVPNLMFMISATADANGNRNGVSWCDVTIAKGGHLIVEDYCGINAADIAIHNGGQLTIGGGSDIFGRQQYYGNAGGIVVDEGGILDVNELYIGAGTDGYEDAEVIVRGELLIGSGIQADGALRATTDLTAARKDGLVSGNLYFPFFDTQYGRYYHNAVVYCKNHDIINGMTDTEFGINGVTTRGQLVTLLYRLAGSPSVEGVSNPFKDVEKGRFYFNAVLWASSNGITSGVSADAFDPNGAVTRQQIAAFLYRYAKYAGYDVDARADLSSFPDAGSVGAFAKNAMRWAVAEGLINGVQSGSDTLLQPSADATRAQVATILYRFITEKAE